MNNELCQLKHSVNERFDKQDEEIANMKGDITNIKEMLQQLLER